MNPKISVIVPVYKAEKYLHRCVDSILAQTFTDFEVLLIDDGSPDRSGEICDEYAQKDARVRVFHKKNGGVSSARNWGLDNAQGEWIAFVDSDDWVENHMLYSLIKDKLDADVIICDFYRHTLDETIIKHLKTDETDTIKRLRYWIQSYTTACCMLIKKELCIRHNIVFPTKIRFREDFYFTTQIMYFAQYVHKINQPLYHYCNTNELSATNSGLPDDQFENIMNMYVGIIDFFKKNNIINKLERELSHGIIRDKHILLFDPTQHQKWRSFFPESHKYIKTCPYINSRIKLLSIFVSWDNKYSNAIICFILNLLKTSNCQ